MQEVVGGAKSGVLLFLPRPGCRLDLTPQELGSEIVLSVGTYLGKVTEPSRCRGKSTLIVKSPPVPGKHDTWHGLLDLFCACACLALFLGGGLSVAAACCRFKRTTFPPKGPAN